MPNRYILALIASETFNEGQCDTYDPARRDRASLPDQRKQPAQHPVAETDQLSFAFAQS
jgi:hypothetical protein